MTDAPRIETTLTPPGPLNLVQTLSPLTRGPGDVSVQVHPGGVVWRATLTPQGPATTRMEQQEGRVLLAAWGDGAEWAVEHAGELLGFHDDDSTFVPTGFLADLKRRHPGIRFGRTRAVYEAMLRSVLEQKVPGKEAAQSYRALVRAWGTPAPGPMPLWIPPPATELAQQPYFAFHPFNVEMKRANTLRLVAQKAARLEATVDLPREEALARMQLLKGIGPWTAAEVMQVAHGDADAVSVGDYHLPHVVSLAFTGEEKGSDERMLELLAPFVPHRARVIRLLGLAGLHVQRKGPRIKLRDFRRY